MSFVQRRSCDGAVTFQRELGGQCFQDKRDQAKEKGALIPLLLSRGKDISAHAQSVGVSHVESKIDLILARTSMFTAPDVYAILMTIYYTHKEI